MVEIERKFLVTSLSFKQQASKHTKITQGFLNKDPKRTVRVRIKDSKGYLTIKGESNASGTSRFEWEHDISFADAKQLLALCEKGIISKTRYEVTVGNHVYEIDVFEGENEGLIVAEVELTHEDEVFEKPSWLGIEVTGAPEYYNSNLSKNPYKNW